MFPMKYAAVSFISAVLVLVFGLWNFYQVRTPTRERPLLTKASGGFDIHLQSLTARVVEAKILPLRPVQNLQLKWIVTDENTKGMEFPGQYLKQVPEAGLTTSFQLPENIRTPKRVILQVLAEQEGRSIGTASVLNLEVHNRLQKTHRENFLIYQ